jgi:hypothetical protein
VFGRALILLAASGCRSLLGFEELADPTPPPGDSPRPDDSAIPRDDSSPPPDTFDPLTCPASYTLTVESSASRYRFVGNQAVPWLTANDRCGMDHPNAHLIVLNTTDELSQISAQTDGSIRWVGLSDRATDTVFIPVTDEEVDIPPASGPPWAIGEPMVGTADCVAINSGELVTLACGNGRNYICECDGIPTDPTNL